MIKHEHFYIRFDEEWEVVENMIAQKYIYEPSVVKKGKPENQDGGVGRHTAPPHTTRTDRESNSKGDQHQGNRK